MASIASSLAASLPKPKYTGEDEEARSATAQRGPRIVTRAELAAATGDTQLVLKRAGPPAYGKRQGWRPRSAEDFGDGGAFPEIPFAQYPLDMGRAGASSTKNNALAIQVDGEGKVKYDAIARQGHSEGRVIHTSFKDLIPLRQRAEAGQLNLDRPDVETVAETTERTKNALALLVNGAVAASKPKTLAHMAGNQKREATYVRYTPASNQMGDTSKRQDRVMKIVERQKDPLEPPKFKHKKIPRGPPSPPPPVMHSPPRKLTAADQEAWKIPPPISNWKNPKGYTVPLDKRLAAAGKGLEDVSINDKFAQFSEALFMADRHAREDVRKRAQMQQLLAEKEKEKKEDTLRQLAQQARAERAEASSSRRRARSDSRSRSRSRSYSRDSRDSRDSGSYRSDSRSRSRSRSPRSRRSRSRSKSYDSRDSQDAAERAREEARKERRRDEERKMRQSRMGGERRMQVLAREQNRDISERVALGLAKPTASSEAMYDSRLFNQTSGFDSGYNEDNIYDKPMFAAQDAISSIYRARGGNGADDDDYDEAVGDAEMAKIQKSSRFGDALGRGTFKGARDAEAREGPVQFEKESAGLSVAPAEADPFNVDQFLSEVGQSSGSKGGEGSSSKRGYGLQEGGSSRQSKRARVEEDD